jgi:signal transduction histidine kinase
VGVPRPFAWLVELCLAGVAAVVGAAFLLIVLSEEPAPVQPGRLIIEVAGGLIVVAALPFLRRRWPVGLALVMIPLGFVFTTAMGATMVALFTVAVRRSWRVTVAVAGLHAATVVVVYRLLIPQDEYWGSMLTIVLLYVALVAVGMLVRSHRALIRSLQERAREAEEGQRLRVEEARHTERERLAREMHDVLAHRISLLAVHAGALEVRRDASAEERQAAGVIRQSAHDALEDLRLVLGMLRDQPGGAEGDRPQPTLADLPDLVEQSRRAGAPVTLDNRLPQAPAVPAGIGRHAYRIVQEALTNARKHAPGSRVLVTLVGRTATDPGDGLTVEVVNLLSGAPVPARIPGAGAGLIGLRERVALVGGRLEHGPTPGGEFRLRAWLPWRP